MIKIITIILIIVVLMMLIKIVVQDLYGKFCLVTSDLIMS